MSASRLWPLRRPPAARGRPPRGAGLRARLCASPVGAGERQKACGALRHASSRPSALSARRNRSSDRKSRQNLGANSDRKSPSTFAPIRSQSHAGGLGSHRVDRRLGPPPSAASRESGFRELGRALRSKRGATPPSLERSVRGTASRALENEGRGLREFLEPRRGRVEYGPLAGDLAFAEIDSDGLHAARGIEPPEGEKAAIRLELRKEILQSAFDRALDENDVERRLGGRALGERAGDEADR